jgi:Flp pilus assembly protein TadD
MPNDAPTGQELFERGDFVGAEAAFRVAVKANREDASALNDLGRALEAQGKLGDATVEYEKAYKRWKSSDRRILQRSVTAPPRSSVGAKC